MKTEGRSVNSRSLRNVCAILASALFATAAAIAQAPAAKPVVYPSKGQSAAQQQKDTSECYTWATQQTGYDPVAVLQAQQADAQKSQQATQAAQAKANGVGGEAVGGAAKGAAAGAAIGAVAGDAGKGAAIGATAGVLRGSARHRAKEQAAQANQQQVQQTQAQAQAAQNQKFADYQKNWSVCMTGRNYAVQ